MQPEPPGDGGVSVSMVAGLGSPSTSRSLETMADKFYRIFVREGHPERAAFLSLLREALHHQPGNFRKLKPLALGAAGVGSEPLNNDEWATYYWSLTQWCAQKDIDPHVFYSHWADFPGWQAVADSDEALAAFTEERQLRAHADGEHADRVTAACPRCVEQSRPV